MLKIVVTPGGEGESVAGDFVKTPKGLTDEKVSLAAGDNVPEHTLLLNDGDKLTVEAKSGHLMLYDKEQMSTRMETPAEKRKREADEKAKAEADKKAEEEAKAKEKAEEAAAKHPQATGSLVPPPSGQKLPYADEEAEDEEECAQRGKVASGAEATTTEEVEETQVGAVEEGVKGAAGVATGMVDSFRNMPMVLALIITNLALMGLFYYYMTRITSRTEYTVSELFKTNDKTFAQWSSVMKDTNSLTEKAMHCILPEDALKLLQARPSPAPPPIAAPEAPVRPNNFRGRSPVFREIEIPLFEPLNLEDQK